MSEESACLAGELELCVMEGRTSLSPIANMFTSDQPLATSPRPFFPTVVTPNDSIPIRTNRSKNADRRGIVGGVRYKINVPSQVIAGCVVLFIPMR